MKASEALEIATKAGQIDSVLVNIAAVAKQGKTEIAKYTPMLNPSQMDKLAALGYKVWPSSSSGLMSSSASHDCTYISWASIDKQETMLSSLSSFIKL